MSTMHRIRQAIEASHQAIELTDFAKSLLDGRITRAAYGNYLAQMWYIHYQLEQLMPACASVSKYFDVGMIRTPAIQRDLHALGSGLDVQVVMPATRRIENQLKSWASTAPYALLGACYILEGSRMGSLMIGRALISSLHIPAVAADHSSAAGVEYHLENASETPKRIKQLKARIDADALSVQLEQELTMGACSFMDSLNELYQQLPVQLSTPLSHTGRCPLHSSAQLTQLKTA